jgi:hypothetical protein
LCNGVGRVCNGVGRVCNGVGCVCDGGWCVWKDVGRVCKDVGRVCKEQPTTQPTSHMTGEEGIHLTVPGAERLDGTAQHHHLPRGVGVHPLPVEPRRRRPAVLDVVQPYVQAVRLRQKRQQRPLLQLVRQDGRVALSPARPHGFVLAWAVVLCPLMCGCSTQGEACYGSHVQIWQQNFQCQLVGSWGTKPARPPLPPMGVCGNFCTICAASFVLPFADKLRERVYRPNTGRW